MSARKQPRILVTVARGNPASEYVDALREAGADPVLASPAATRSRLLDFDGLMLTGGGDVQPTLYGGDSPLAEEVDAARDEFESALLREARDHHVPVLCICRGLQIANVTFGGTLISDLARHFGTEAMVPHSICNPDGRTERGVIPEHVVAIDEESMLRRIVGSGALATGARHHQAVDRCAGDLRVTAHTADGVVEALEARFDSPFWLAVQWHPESTRRLDDGASRAIFSAFVRTARAQSGRCTETDAER